MKRSEIDNIDGRWTMEEGRRSLKYSMGLLILLTIFCLASCNLTDEFKEMKADELKKLIDEGAQTLIVDNRTEMEYREGHIPKAMNISQEKFIVLEMLLPKDKNLPIVFYCRGAG